MNYNGSYPRRPKGAYSSYRTAGPAAWAFGPLAIAAFFLISTPLLATCNGSGTWEGPGNGSPSGACVEDADCPDNHRCVQGFCEEHHPPACELTGCGPGEFCDPDDGLCKGPGEKPCTTDADCGDDFVCPPSVDYCMQPCVLDTDCDEGFVCNNELEVCVECRFDPDCIDPERPHCLSEEGRCVECLDAMHCDSGYYCDLAEGSSQRHACREGCLENHDCTPGTRCERPGDAPGRCVECSVETAMEDCRDGARQRCHPDLLICVTCFQHSHCTAPTALWCHQEDWVCVQCLQHDHCQKGTVCVAETSTCEVGCTSDERCPPIDAPELEHCDTNRGAHGECVECLGDDHCELGYKCTDGACVEGCDGDHNCPEDRPRCDLVADRCVECLVDADCAPHRRCDPFENACRCLDVGDACSASAECGNPQDWPDVPWWDGVCLQNVWCVVELKCDDTSDEWRSLVPGGRCAGPCSLVDQRDDCPSGFCCRRVRNAEGDPQGLKCVSDPQCPDASCRN